jgi:hypothetical protein
MFNEEFPTCIATVGKLKSPRPVSRIRYDDSFTLPTPEKQDKSIESQVSAKMDRFRTCARILP